MGLANLLLPNQGWDDFWFNNWIDHQEIQQAIQKKTGINLPIYVIDPWNEDNYDGILRRHQFYHNDMNLTLGSAGEDLTVIDFEDRNSVNGWVDQHYQEHLAIHQILGMT